MTAYNRVLANLEYLKLSRTAEIIDGVLERASKNESSFLQVLDELLEEEKSHKEQKSLKIRTNIAGFPFRKTFEQFDFSFQPSIDKKTIDELCTMRFVQQQENVILLGPPGVGKTHLAISLGIEVLRNNFSTYFINCHDLISALKKAHFENTLENKLKTYSKYKLLIIDEVGYLPFDLEGANLFFQLVSRKYEKSSIILTSNKGFADWGEIFGDNVIAAALLDRLLHYCTIINIKGDSYRIKERRKFFRPEK